MIEIIDLWKKFESNPVLKGVDLKIKTGESLVIIGRSGCGKSVLLKHIIGLLKPENGKVIINGEDITKYSGEELYKIQNKFGMLFQSAALFDSMTVGENVSFALDRYTSYSRKKIARIVDEKLALVGLHGIEKLKPAELSGGMKKRVGLARAIAMDPQFILFDEPTTGLDPIMADAINDLIVDIKNKIHITSIAVTHDMVSAYKIADRITMLYDGKIIESGTPRKIKKTKNPYVKQFINGEAKGPITTLT